MATDVFLTQDAVNKVFQNLTITLLGLTAPTTTDKSSYGKVRVSYPPEGQPAWKVTDDVCFLSVFERDGEYNKPRHVIMQGLDADNANQETTYTRILEASWVFYGPSSFDNARKVKDGLFYELYRDTLAGHNLYPVPSSPNPVRIPEVFQGQWWERVDLRMLFNEQVVVNLTVPYLKSAEITVEEGNGDQTIVEVTEELYDEMT